MSSAGTWGGARPNSGPKGRDYVKSEAELELEEQRARHERIKADQREHDLAIKQGLFLEKALISQASATALSVLTQTMRSLPDNLERTCSLTPEQAEAAAQAVDAALLEIAQAFRAMSGELG